MKKIEKLIEEKILPHFDIDGDFVSISTPSSNGNINNTFVINYINNGIVSSYVLQRINTTVFKNPFLVMENIKNVTAHIKKKHPNEECLEVISLKQKDFRDQDVMLIHENEYGETSYWRMYNCITNSISYDTSTNPEVFKKVGIAFANFHKDLSDFSMGELNETIENFHNTRIRFLDLLSAIKTGIPERILKSKPEIDYLCKHRHDYSIITELLEEEAIPYRVTHNDTKINNVLMDKVTDEVKCVIDLDTIMPGSALYDIGDAIRSGASSASETEVDLSKVYLDLDLARAFLEGYLENMNGELTKEEINNIPNSILVITLELAMRFLTDYLLGDQYFKVPDDDKELNLKRCQNQIALAKDIERKLPILTDIVKSINMKNKRILKKEEI